MKHAGAHTIAVSLQTLPDVLRIAVQDDGAGFAPGESATDHFGLVGMKERAKEIGADLQVTSQPRMGTTVVVDFPVKKTSEGALRVGVRQSVKAEL